MFTSHAHDLNAMFTRQKLESCCSLGWWHCWSRMYQSFASVAALRKMPRAALPSCTPQRVHDNHNFILCCSSLILRLLEGTLRACMASQRSPASYILVASSLLTTIVDRLTYRQPFNNLYFNTVSLTVFILFTKSEGESLIPQRIKGSLSPQESRLTYTMRLKAFPNRRSSPVKPSKCDRSAL